MRIIILVSLFLASPAIAENADVPAKGSKVPAAKCGKNCSGSPPDCKCPARSPKAGRVQRRQAV